MKGMLRFVVIFVSLLSMAVASSTTKWPENVSPTTVYNTVEQLNAYADRILKAQKITKWQKTPDIKSHISPMVVFQLSLATVEMLHAYELSLKMRPLPIFTSSPIAYYPADVNYVSELILARMRRIAKHFDIKSVPTIKEIKHKKTPAQVYRRMLHFYMKLSALNGIPELTPNVTYSQMHRANEELKDIVLHYVANIKDVRKKRLLAASTYGSNPYGGKALETAPSTVETKDTYQKILALRDLIAIFLVQNNIQALPIPTYSSKQTIKPVDVFIQSQVIIAELSEWKRAIGVVSSTPITVQATNKTPSDVYQQALSLIYMMQRLQMVHNGNKA